MILYSGILIFSFLLHGEVHCKIDTAKQKHATLNLADDNHAIQYSNGNIDIYRYGISKKKIRKEATEKLNEYYGIGYSGRY